MMTRRAALASGAAALAMPACAGENSLRTLASAKGILFGSAAATYELKDADFTGLLPREAAILVPEYEMKRDVTEPVAGTYDFSGCDALLDFAQTHKMQMRCQPAVIDYLADLCQRPELGARHVDALIDRQLLPNVARTLLGFMVEDNVPDILSLVMDENKQIACEFLDLADAAAGSEANTKSEQAATA